MISRISIHLNGEALKIGDRHGFAFSLFGLETGHRSTKMIEKFVREGRRVEWINHLACPDLSGRERLEFVHAFLRTIRDAGCLGAIEWTRGYYPQGAFYRARFFPCFRAVNLCSWIFEPGLSFGKIKDVYEIQA